jgi:hypothetical protein
MFSVIKTIEYDEFKKIIEDISDAIGDAEMKLLSEGIILFFSFFFF